MNSLFKKALMVTLVMVSAGSAIHSIERGTTTKKITKAYIKTKKAKKSGKAPNKVFKKKTKQQPQQPVLGSLDCALCGAKNFFKHPMLVVYFLCDFCQKGNDAQDGHVIVSSREYGDAPDDSDYDNGLCS